MSPAPETRTPTLTLLLTGNDPLQVSAELLRQRAAVEVCPQRPGHPLSLRRRTKLGALSSASHSTPTFDLFTFSSGNPIRHTVQLQPAWNIPVLICLWGPSCFCIRSVAPVRCQCFCSEQSRMEIRS
ncbi:hypothetical protein SRHO_G00051530 [Serrasalmus rhombeus]